MGDFLDNSTESKGSRWTSQLTDQLFKLHPTKPPNRITPVLIAVSKPLSIIYWTILVKIEAPFYADHIVDITRIFLHFIIE